MRKNANEIIFDEIIVLGTPALFTDWRVDRASVPADMKMYEIRHAERIGVIPASWQEASLLTSTEPS